MTDTDPKNNYTENTTLSKILPADFWSGKTAKPDAEVYRCARCRDTGWLLNDEGAYPCTCLQARLLEKQKAAAGLQPALRKHHFDGFRLDFYSPQLQDNDGRSYRQLAENALAAAKEFVAAFLTDTPQRGLFLQGEVGRGKTYLAAAIVNALVEQGQSALFMVVPELLDQLRYTYNDDSAVSEGALMHRVQQAPVLVLDDLGSHNYSEWTKNKIYSLLNYRLNNDLPVIITSNLGLNELKEILGLRTVSRIVECCDFYLLCAEKDNRLKVRAAKGASE